MAPYQIDTCMPTCSTVAEPDIGYHITDANVHVPKFNSPKKKNCSDESAADICQVRVLGLVRDTAKLSTKQEHVWEMDRKSERNHKVEKWCYGQGQHRAERPTVEAHHPDTVGQLIEVRTFRTTGSLKGQHDLSPKSKCLNRAGPMPSKRLKPL
ncbi:unnamed protein product [Dovyalis caffra]|uniref:Uncharacterized protein n=1 Tax=Dovyalis caffra TaxID=77055 RepID=A0AAV1RLP4_9ROSI|nr:unnamed protein product [Dovyalis caffra]